jgi:hypothetical protein
MTHAPIIFIFIKRSYYFCRSYYFYRVAKNKDKINKDKNNASILFLSRSEK